MAEAPAEPVAANHTRVWVAIVATLLTIALAQAFYDVSTWGQWPPDFEAYWDSGSRLRQGALIYQDPDSAEATDAKAYIYPPVFAALFAPLTWFPIRPAASLWAALHLIFAGVLVFKLLQLVGRKGIAWQLGALLCCVLLVPLTQEMREGQVNLPVLMLFAMGLVDLKRGKHKQAGLWLALAAHCKILPIVVLPLLLLGGRREAAKWMVLSLLALALLPLVWTVPNRGLIDGVQDLVFNYMDWIELVFVKALKTSTPAGLEQFFAFNNSGHAVAHRWFADVFLQSDLDPGFKGPLLFSLPPVLLKIVGFGVPLAMYAATCVLAFKRKSVLLALILGFLAAQFLNLLFWDHHLLSLTLLVGAMLAAGAEFRRIWIVFAPFVVFMTLPFLNWYLLQTTSWKWPTGLLQFNREWGFPTFAFLIAWGCAFRQAWRLPAESESEPSSLQGASQGLDFSDSEA